MKCISYQSIFSYKKSFLGLITQHFQSHYFQPSGKSGLFLFVSLNPISECFRNGELFFFGFFPIPLPLFRLLSQKVEHKQIASYISFAEPGSLLDLGLVSQEHIFAFISFEVSFYFHFHLVQLVSCQITNTTSRLYEAVHQRDISDERQLRSSEVYGKLICPSPQVLGK